MVLCKRTTRTFHRRLYAGEMETITCLKRNNDLQEGTVRTATLFDCRWSMIFKLGEPIHDDMAANDNRLLHVPRISMEKVGIEYFNAADRFVDKQGRYWMPEAPQTLTSKLWENHVCIECRRTDALRLPVNG